MADIDYAGWAQAAVAGAAILGAPIAWQAFVAKFRTHLTATSVPLDSDPDGSSVFWRISFRNKRRRIVRDTIWLYPAHEGVVAKAVRCDANDGGRSVTAETNGGSIKFDIERLGAGRVFEATVSFSRYSHPVVEGESGAINHVIDSSEGTVKQRVRGVVAVAQYRMMVLMLQFVAGFIVVLVALFRQGVIKPL